MSLARKPAVIASVVCMSRHPTFISLALIAALIACQPEKTPRPGRPAVPQLRATVVTIRTSLMPEKRTFDTMLVIAGHRARSTAELDVWRLYDLDTRTVTVVDEVAKTVRTDPFDTILKQRKLRESPRLPSHFPAVKFSQTQEAKMLQGVKASQSLIVSGAYRRELWLAEHPAIPAGLFAMMHASESPSSPLAPMMKEVDAALALERRFPLLDRSTVPVGKNDIVIERTVTSIGPRDVPKALFEIPREYRDLTERAPAKR